MPTFRGGGLSLLIGDSIANFGSGYAGNVKQLLGRTVVPGGSGPDDGGPKTNAAVSAPRAYPQGSGFCGSSFGVVDCASYWLGEQLQYRWDVIHFNWGLHDIDACELPLSNINGPGWLAFMQS